MLLKSDTMSLQQLVQSTSVYKTACLFSVHVVKSVSLSTVWFSFKQAHICSDLYILLRLPLHTNPHSEKIPRMPVRLVQRLHPVQMVPIYFTEIVLVFVRFLCQNFSFYFVLVFWITIVLVLWKWRPIILVLVLIFVTKITLVGTWKQSLAGIVECKIW